MKVTKILTVVLVAALLGTAGSWAQGPVRAGDLREFKAETPHPYPLGEMSRPAVWQDRIFSPGAEFLRVHFDRFQLDVGDFVTISNPEGTQQHVYRDRGPHGDGDFWAFSIDGDEAIVTLHGGVGGGFGYSIDQVGHGTLRLGAPVPEVVCSTDGREDAECHTSDPTFDDAQAAVARLLFFIQGQGFFVCTGWLVDGSNANSMLTNNHCFSGQNATSSVEALFNFQNTTCGGSPGTATQFNGGTLLKTNKKLDYTLFTLLGNPEGTFGELTGNARVPSVGEQIWFIQHPGGGLKEVGFYEDVVGGAVCDVHEIDQTYGTSQRNSQMGYACDSEGGSSGSPIVAAGTTEAIGLHHFGNVSSSECLNGASQMSKVCDNAGTLLNCIDGGNGGGCDPGPGAKGDSCTQDSDCASCKCKGPAGNKTCK